MGQLTQRLGIDACLNCGSKEFDMLSPDERREYRWNPFVAKCSVCDILYAIESVPLSGTSVAVDPRERDLPRLYARNI